MNTMSKTDLAEKNAYHIERMNGEMGELRDAQRQTTDDIKQVTLAIGTLRTTVTQIGTDLDWIKRILWVVITSTIGGLVMSFLNYFQK